MAKKRTKRRNRKTSGVIEEISEAEKEGKLVIGSNMILRHARKGGLKAVIYATNMPEGRKEDLEKYCSVSSLEMKEFDGDSMRLGESCGKPFNVLMVGIKK